MTRRYAFRIVVFLLTVAASAEAQEGLTPYQVAMTRTVGEAVVSPDGDFIAYTVNVPADPFEANEAPRTELHLYRLADGMDRVLAGTEVNARNLQWVPRSDAVSYLARGEGDAATALFTVEAASGTVRRALAFETGIVEYAWHPDGRRVAFTANEPRRADSAMPYRPEVYEEGLTQRPVFVTRAFEDSRPMRIDVEGTAYALAWHPGDRLAVAVAPTPLVDDRYMRQTIKLYHATRGEYEGAVVHEGKLGPMAWSLDGERLAFIGSANVNDPQAGRLYVVDDDGGEPTEVLPGFEGHVTAFEWLDEDTIGYVAAVGVETVYAAIEEDGDAARTVIPPGAAAFNTVSANSGGDIVALVASTPAHPPELYVWTQDDRRPQRLTHSNPWLDGVALAPQRVVTYEARDGLELQGLLIEPLGGSDGPAPLLVVVHGGPESHYSNGWLTGYSSPGQMAAARGYAVFYPNYRGSTGRGVAFATLSQGDPAGAEFDDLIDGIDALIEAGVADSARVGVTGGSYGGYATGWLSTRYSDRIAAGVMFVGIADKISKVGTTDIPGEEFYVHARKRPWDDWPFFLERSPIYYAGQGRTPLLILHGKEDPRVNPGQSMELYRHLKLRGQAPVRLVLYPGEGHGNGRATARYDYSLRMLQWFDHYLLGEGGEPPAHEIDYGAPTPLENRP